MIFVENNNSKNYMNYNPNWKDKENTVDNKYSYLSEKIILADYVDDDIYIKTLDKDSLLENSFRLTL